MVALSGAQSGMWLIDLESRIAHYASRLGRKPSIRKIFPSNCELETIYNASPSATFANTCTSFLQPVLLHRIYGFAPGRRAWRPKTSTPPIHPKSSGFCSEPETPNFGSACYELRHYPSKAVLFCFLNKAIQFHGSRWWKVLPMMG